MQWVYLYISRLPYKKNYLGLCLFLQLRFSIVTSFNKMVCCFINTLFLHICSVSISSWCVILARFIALLFKLIISLLIIIRLYHLMFYCIVTSMCIVFVCQFICHCDIACGLLLIKYLHFTPDNAIDGQSSPANVVRCKR